jgi:hypothetical protein
VRLVPDGGTADDRTFVRLALDVDASGARAALRVVETSSVPPDLGRVLALRPDGTLVGEHGFASPSRRLAGPAFAPPPAGLGVRITHAAGEHVALQTGDGATALAQTTTDTACD